MTSGLLLYTTAGCHLCEHAEDILYQQKVAFLPVDIEEDVSLIQRYGTRIPVVADARGRELDWPFDNTTLTNWLAPNGG
ncbi:MAG: glutaredoxin family protein [Cellvibrionales bacterium]